MCGIERVALQRGMNYRIRGLRSVLLMSTRPNAPYEDQVTDNGRTLIYEGHDVPRSSEHPDPKAVDQPLVLPSGKPTQNGLFYQAATERGQSADAERVWVYEKIKTGIWVYNGCFALRDAEIVRAGARQVCRFRLELLDNEQDSVTTHQLDHTRIIPSAVKQAVWKRDGGHCVQCGATDNLHFDHIIPYSKGGTSLLAENIQLLCARHNLAKRTTIA